MFKLNLDINFYISSALFTLKFLDESINVYSTTHTLKEEKTRTNKIIVMGNLKSH